MLPVAVMLPLTPRPVLMATIAPLTEIGELVRVSAVLVERIGITFAPWGLGQIKCPLGFGYTRLSEMD